MNNELNAIFTRRSIRSYQDKKIPDSIVNDILEAAMAAPSAVAKDPWEFIVVKEKATLSKIADGLPSGQMLRNAAIGIIVCGDLNQAHDNLLSYMIQDCSAAIENILLATSMLGLGACWLGVHPREERINYIKDLFQLPDNIVPISAIAIGYPGEKKAPRTRVNAEKVHLENW